MVMLRDEVYCRQSVLCEALGASSKTSHLVRRLLLGVFKKDVIYHVTLTGQAPRAAGREQNASKQLLSLDNKAKVAIISEFSLLNTLLFEIHDKYILINIYDNFNF